MKNTGCSVSGDVCFRWYSEQAVVVHMFKLWYEPALPSKMGRGKGGESLNTTFVLKDHYHPAWCVDSGKEGKFYLMTHTAHFIYDYL